MANLTRIKNNQITDSTITNVKIASATLTGDLMNPQLTFNSNLILNGNLTVSGNFTAVQSTTTQITDPLITLGMGNPGISYDLGSVLIRGSGGNRFMGWKENAEAFVFINTAEDGTTTGNIPTTAYSNVIIGNLISLGSSDFGDISLTGNSIIARGGLTLESGSGLTTISNAAILSSSLSVGLSASIAGTTTVNALISNGAIQGTTISAFSNATVNALTVNNSATVGTTFQSLGGIQNTVIGNVTASDGYFVNLDATGNISGASALTLAGMATVNELISNGTIQGTALSASANATVEALTVNNSATIGSTLSVNAGIQDTPIGNLTPNTGNFTTLNASDAASFASIISNGAIQGTDISGSGTGTFASIISNGAIQGTDISGSGTGIFASIISNGAIQGTTLSASANATVEALTVNTSVTISESLGINGNIVAGNVEVNGTAVINQITILGGIQDTPIGNITPSTGNFTSLNSTNTATVNELVSNGTIQGTDISGTNISGSGTGTFASVVSNGAIQGTTISGSGTGTFASVVSNGAIQGTTLSASANATVEALTVNSSTTIGSTLSVLAGIQDTPIGNTTASSGNFTTLNATGAITGATTLTTSDTATVNALTVNNAATVGTTLVTGGAATVNALTSNTSIEGATLSITGNAVVGNLTVHGNLITVNSQTLVVIDPIVELNTGPNGTPLTTDNNFDSGIRTHYYDTADRSAFFGRTDDTGFFEYYSNVTSETGNVIVGTYGTIKTGNLQLTESARIDTTLSVGSNATVNALTVNNSATVGTILSVTGGIQDTVIGNVIAAAGYFTTTNATGNATVNALTINNSAIIGSTLGVVGNINASNINITSGEIRAESGYYTGNVTVLGNLNASVGVVYANSGIVYGDPVTGNNAMYVGIPDYTYLGSDIVMQVTGNVNNYSQINFQNINDGTDASTDLVLTADNGTDSSNYIDLGIGSSNYALAGYSAYYPNDGYLLIDGGNLLLNVENPTKAVRFVVGSYDETELVALINDNGLEIVKSTSSTNNLTGALILAGGAGIAGAINGGSSLNVVGTATVNELISNSAIQGTTISGSGTGTFASVISNGAIQGTTLSASANATVEALTVNGSATIGTTISVGAGIQNTPIGNATASSGNFTTLTADTSLNTSGIATVNELVSNGAIQGTDISGSGTGTFASVVSNGAIQGTTISGSGTGTFASVISNGAIQGTTLSASANATVEALTVNSSATIGSTLNVAAGIQDTPIGNIIASSGNFTSLTASGLTTITDTTDSTGITTGALVIDGGVGIAKALNVGTTATLSNLTITDNTISSNITNSGITINPNGTGSTVINDGLNTSKTIINGTSANTLVISGSQVGVNAASFISGATLQVNSSDSILLPVGAQGERPGSPQAGMFRYSTTQGAIEWYTGTKWDTASAQTTIAIANTQVGNGSATTFTIPVANATTAGTIVSINGVVQQPISSYAVSGNTVEFTEPPSSTDIIDFRVFTTTSQVTSIVDTAGTTGIFLEPTGLNDKIILFKTNDVESFSIQANSQAQFTGNIVPTANITYSLGTTDNRWKDLWLSGSTIYLGNVQIKESAGTLSFYAADGVTPAPVQADVSDAGGIQNTPIGNATPSTGAFTTLSASGQFTSTLATGTAPFSIASTTKVTNLNVEQVDGYHAAQTGTVNTIVVRDASGYANVAGLINSGATGTGNIGSASIGFNTVFAKATSAQYADLAENYLGDAYYEPGTVVEFGGDNEVTISTNDMSTRIAGVVSTNPAYLMNSKVIGFAVPVALQGRVPCKVKGTIRKGDMMVSAGNGFARAESNPVLGSIIGKALENFDDAEGVIEVVVGRL